MRRKITKSVFYIKIVKLYKTSIKMIKQEKKLKVFEQIILEHLLTKRRRDLLNILSGENPCFYMNGYELLDVSDLVFTNLMIDPDKWFKKLEGLVALALEHVLKDVSEAEVNNSRFLYLKGIVYFHLSSLTDPFIIKSLFKRTFFNSFKILVLVFLSFDMLFFKYMIKIFSKMFDVR